MYTCLGPKCKNKVEDPYLFCSYECGAYAGCFDVKEGWFTDKVCELAIKNGRVSAYQHIKRSIENPMYLPGITTELINNPPFEAPLNRKDAVEKLMSILKPKDISVLKKIPHPVNLEKMKNGTGKAIIRMFQLNDNYPLIRDCTDRQIEKITEDVIEGCWLTILQDVWRIVKGECNGCNAKQKEKTESKENNPI